MRQKSQDPLLPPAKISIAIFSRRILEIISSPGFGVSGIHKCWTWLFFGLDVEISAASAKLCSFLVWIIGSLKRMARNTTCISFFSFQEFGFIRIAGFLKKVD